MKDAYGAVVIGSGFGGAVAACRLAQAGIDVAILERGRRYPRGSFPRRFDGLADGWLWAREQGLFDVKPLQEIQLVQAAGYGGGSLIYANVHLRPPDDVFAGGWPRGYSRSALDPYYDLVGYMLDVKPITSGGVIPKKTLLMKKLADKLGRAEQLCHPNIAVDLRPPGELAPNKFGVLQSGCTHCGECDIGCNVHAKNTLDLNYLALAERAGAQAFTQCEVWNIARSGRDEKGEYVVSYRDHGEGGVARTLRAGKVFLCAGAVSSTELLLRCRDEHGTLPDVGERLGQGYSGNGDFLAATYQTEEPFEPSKGPVITAGIVFDRGEGDDRVWFILEDGGFPAQVASFASLLAPGAEWLRGAASWLKDDLERAFRVAAEDRLARHDPPDVANTALFLAMGRDRANGRIELSPLTHALKVTWDVPSNMPLYSGTARILADVSEALGGALTLNPFWKRLHVPVSVHSLGGCGMSDDPRSGVTSPIGEVYNYPGLYVLDGSILPAATGVNPSSTIAAVAERNIEAILRAHLNDPDWRAPERAHATPIDDPFRTVRVPSGGCAAPRASSVGVAFTETMRGSIARGFVPVKEDPTVFRAAQKAGAPAKFTLKITIPDLDCFLADKAHAGIAAGRLVVDGFTSQDGAAITNGVFNLFVKDGSFYERKMLYLLPFTGNDGRPYLFDGYKDVEDHGSFDLWASTSTLYTVIREGHSALGPVVAAGILVIEKLDFLHQLTTFEAPGAEGTVERLAALARFGQSFMGTLWDVFARPRLP